MTGAHPYRVLIAVDDSPRAEHVYARGVELAEHMNGEIVVVRAVGIAPDVPREALAAPPEDVPGLLSRLAAREVDRIVASVASSLMPRVRIEVGVAADVIRRVAEEEDANLVVIGAHGYSAVERLIGTTASRVVNTCSRSVLVVR